ncbi:MAG TPA: NAD(P)H-dependent oxidoreductase [Acidimicrobiia bacterium]|nr:NAD(P)H-dependent oxidoreductase [Acidimicrobiia bacterium]
MTEPALRLGVVIGSTREGRFADVVARWFLGQVRRRDDVEVDVIDLAAVDLPTVHPRERTAPLLAYLDRIARADAFVVITPEYNHGYPGPLKHAIDLAYEEWRAKPAGFVSYGGLGGGLRAVEQLRQVFAELHVVTVRDTVSFHLAHQQFDERGEPRDAAAVNAAAAVLLDQLVWWGRALRAARALEAA